MTSIILTPLISISPSLHGQAILILFTKPFYAAQLLSHTPLLDLLSTIDFLIIIYRQDYTLSL